MVSNPKVLSKFMDGLPHECWSKRVSAVERAAERLREHEDLQ